MEDLFKIKFSPTVMQEEGEKSVGDFLFNYSSPLEPRDHNEPGISEHVCWNV